jgi:ribonuclease BN (tRNA processing enzyme)
MMMKKWIWQIWLLLLFLSASRADVVLLVLGSGGPEMNDGRASSAYIVWVDKKARILVDFGGGASLRFEQSKTNIADIDVILLTHLHIDHTADLPALIKASFFTNRSRDLPIYGPHGNSVMPSTETFVKRLFENGRGAWQYMGDFLDGSAAFALKPHTVAFGKKPRRIYRQKGITIDAVSVHHGPIPALAYRVEVQGHAIVFSGDMNGAYHSLELLAKDADVLVAHNAVPKGAKGVAAALHMTPDIIGKIAAKAKPQKVILSHRMRRTLGKEHQTLSEIRKYYKRSVKFADDGSRYRVK